MTYVMSDLHGMYDRFIAMLEKIDFSDSDELFIIGDIIDRGERPVDILEYVMDKPNITVLLGNHEVMARDFLRRLTAEITDENTASFLEHAVLKKNQDKKEPCGVEVSTMHGASNSVYLILSIAFMLMKR